MASFIGALESYNPYVQQIPTDAYVKVGMFKEQEYQAGVKRVQDTIDNIAGLDIANEGGRQYLRARVDELTQSLNKYSTIDFSNVNNVTQLVGLAKPLYQDENIVTDVINTGIYRKWAKDAGEAFKNGKMEMGQYVREMTDANVWLNSKSAGSSYTGRQAPNTATKKELVDKIVKYKKDGIDMNEFVYDVAYDKDKPYYVKATNKYYSEAEFNNFIVDAVMSSSDREMLMNDHWYENQGVPTEALQKQDLQMYQDKINSNLKEIDRIKNDPILYTGEKKIEAQKTIDELLNYNKQLSKGKIKFLQERNLNDPTSRDVFHRDLAESRFLNSMSILRNQVQKEELQKNEVWFQEKKAELDAMIENIKNANSGTKTGTGSGTKTKTPEEQINEVAVFTPVSENAPKTEVSLNVIQEAWSNKNQEINSSMNNLMNVLGKNGVNLGEFISGWDQVQMSSKAGAAVQVPRFKNEAAKNKFYNLVAGLNWAYTKEAQDGHMDNKSFTSWVKKNFTGYKDDDPNSKFNLSDKMIADGLNIIKGNAALLPKLEAIFADKGVTRTLAQMDEALKNKKDMANAYREALIKSNSLKAEEAKNVRNISDDDLMNKNYILDKDKEKKRFGDSYVVYRVKKETDGTYSIYQDVFDKDSDFGEDQEFRNKGTMRVPGSFDDYDPVKKGAKETRKIVGGYTDEDEATEDARWGGSISSLKGISEKSLERAEDFIKQTYSYVQENLNSTAQNMKEDKPRYEAFKSGMATFLSSSLGKAGVEDIEIIGLDDITGITGIENIEINTFSVSNTQDIFNPNPKVNITFSATNTKDKDPKTTKYTANVSLRSFLATNPSYREPGYAKYFGPVLYAQKDAFARLKSAVNPLEGSESSYASGGGRQWKDQNNPGNIEPVYNYQKNDGSYGFQYDDAGQFGADIQWETIPIEKDGKQTMITYQVVSLGQNTTLGNMKNRDGQQYEPGAYYVKMRVPTTGGKSQVIFLKNKNGDSWAFNNASAAHYMVRDLIFNSPDTQLEEMNAKTNEVNYLTLNPQTIRGILNSQLLLNGFPKIEIDKLRAAIAKAEQKQALTAQEQELINQYKQQEANLYGR